MGEFLKLRNEWVLAVAGNQKGVMLLDEWFEGWKAVLQALISIVFVIDALWSRRCGEIVVLGLERFVRNVVGLRYGRAMVTYDVH